MSTLRCESGFRGCTGEAVYDVAVKCRTCPTKVSRSLCLRCADLARRGEIHGCHPCGYHLNGATVQVIETLVTP
jgi:hypothetical protein